MLLPEVARRRAERSSRSLFLCSRVHLPQFLALLLAHALDVLEEGGAHVQHFLARLSDSRSSARLFAQATSNGLRERTWMDGDDRVLRDEVDLLLPGLGLLGAVEGVRPGPGRAREVHAAQALDLLLQVLRQSLEGHREVGPARVAVDRGDLLSAEDGDGRRVEGGGDVTACT